MLLTFEDRETASPYLERVWRSSSHAAGEFLSDVAVKLVRDEQEVATFRAAGPRCLIRAPEGSYNIEASYKGQAKSIKVSTGTRNAQLRW